MEQNSHRTVERQYAGEFEVNQMVLTLPTLSPELPVILYFPIVSRRPGNCKIMPKSLAFLENLTFKVKYQSKT